MSGGEGVARLPYPTSCSLGRPEARAARRLGANFAVTLNLEPKIRSYKDSTACPSPDLRPPLFIRFLSMLYRCGRPSIFGGGFVQFSVSSSTLPVGAHRLSLRTILASN